MTVEFITTRELKNKAGEVKGKVKIMKLAEESDTLVEYTCPECSYTERKKDAWAEPLVSGTGANKKFLVKCGKCGHEMKFLKLKKEAAKEMKKK